MSRQRDETYLTLPTSLDPPSHYISSYTSVWSQSKHDDALIKVVLNLYDGCKETVLNLISLFAALFNFYISDINDTGDDKIKDAIRETSFVSTVS